MSQTNTQTEVHTSQTSQVPNTNSTPTSNKPKKKSKGLYIFLGCLILVICSLVTCCITFFVMTTYMPGKLLSMFVSDEPLDIVQPAPWSEQEMEDLMVRFDSAMQAGEPVRLSGEEATQLLSGSDPNLEVFKIDVNEEDQAVVDLSYKLEDTDKYLNAHVVGDIEIEDGEFSTFLVEEFMIGNFNMGQFLQGNDMAADINTDMQSEMEPGQENPIEGIEYFGVEDGEFLIQLDSSFFEETDTSTNYYPNAAPTEYMNYYE
ncbi:hypothetical protein GF362_03915 [Candidatus Dojkabacteria bacterium]|nr:hypothetical protein [Candidatus Dojkabacteria bacterium]